MARSVSSSKSDDDDQTKKRDRLKKSPLKSRPARRESSSSSSASSSDSSSPDSDSRKRRSSHSRRVAGRHDDSHRDKDRSSRHRKESPAKRNSSDRPRNDSRGRCERESRRRSPSRDKEAHRSGSRNKSKVSDSRSKNRSDKRSRSKSVQRSRNRSGRRSRSRTDRRSRRSRSREGRRIGQTARERFEAVVGYAEPRVERWSGSRFSSWNRFSPRRRRSPERRRDRRSRSRSKLRNRRSQSGHKNRSRSRSARRRRRSSSSSSKASSSSSSSSSRESRTPGRKNPNETISPKKKDVDKTSHSKEGVAEKSEISTKKPIDKKDCDQKPIVEDKDRDEKSVPSHEREKKNSGLTVPESESSTAIRQSPGTAQIPDCPTAGKNIANNSDESVRRDSTEKHQVSDDVPVTAVYKANESVVLNHEEIQAHKTSSGDPFVSESGKEGEKLQDQHAMSPSKSESNHEGHQEKSYGLKNNDQSNDDNSSLEVEDRPREHGYKGPVRRHYSSNESKSPDLPVRAEESDWEENVKQAPASKKRRSKSPSFEHKEVPSDSSRQENSDTLKESPRKIHSRDDVKNSLDEGLSKMEDDTEQKSLRSDYRDRHQIKRDASELKKGISIEQKHLYQDYKKNSSLLSDESRTNETNVSEQPDETATELVKDVSVDVGRKHLSDRASKKISGDIFSSDSDVCATEKDRRTNYKKKETKENNTLSDDEVIESVSDQSAHAEKKKKKERNVREKKKASSASGDSDDSDSDELVVPEKKTKKHSRKKNKKKSKKLEDDSNSNSDDARKKRSKRKLEKSSRSKKGHHNKTLLAEREEGALTESEEDDEKELMRKKRRIEEQLKREMEMKDKEEKRKVEEKLAEVREFEKRHAEVKERENRYRPERPDCADEVIGERYWGAKDSKGGSKLSKNSDTYWNKYADELGIQIEEPRRRENRERDRENRKRDDKEPEAKRSKLDDPDKRVAQEGTQLATAIKKPVVDPLQTRTGGAYIPPAKLRMMQAEITDKSSAAFQRLAWEALKKSINGLVNKVNVSNIGIIVRELLKENVVRGRGVLCRSLMQAQAFSLTFTHVYAALVAVLNSKFPQIGLLLLNRLIIQFRRGIKRNDKSICLSSSRFIAHLMNQQVAHEVVALEILTFLLEKVQDVTDTTEVGDKSRNNCAELAAAFLRECGQKLQDLSPRCSISIFGSVKDAINEGKLDDRVKYMFEAIWSEGRNNFKDNPAVIEELDLVEEDDQITHIVELDGKLDSEDILNVFRHDPEYKANEEKYKEIQASILGESDDEEGSGDDGSESSDSESDDGDESKTKEGQEIIDQTEGNMLAFRRTIYLTLRSSLTVDEATHKILKGEIKPGWEMELGNMILDCCAQERTFIKFFALIAQRFCNINRVYRECFQEIFKTAYETCHRLDIDKLRNVVRLFAHLFVTDAISWEVFSVVLLNADNTTSSSRVFLKILFQEMAEFLGLSKLNDRLRDPTLSGAFEGLLPRDNPRNTRFAINFFTSIGLGGLTDGLREFLRLQPKPTAIVAPVVQKGDGSGSSSSSGSGSSSSSSSESSDESSESSSSSNSESSDSSSSSSSDSSSSDSDSSSSSSDDRKRSREKKAGARNRDRRTSSAVAPPDTPSHRLEDSSRRDDNRRRNESRRRHEEEGRQREESGRRRIEGSRRRADEDTTGRRSGRNASEDRETEEQRGESRRRRVSDSKRRSEHDKRAPRDGSRTRHRR